MNKESINKMKEEKLNIIKLIEKNFYKICYDDSLSNILLTIHNQDSIINKVNDTYIEDAIDGDYDFINSSREYQTCSLEIYSNETDKGDFIDYSVNVLIYNDLIFVIYDFEEGSIGYEIAVYTNVDIEHIEALKRFTNEYKYINIKVNEN